MKEEIIRVIRSDYESILERAKKIRDHTDEPGEKSNIANFLDRKNFPTIEDLEYYDVKYNIRKYLEYLVFYSVYSCDDPEFEKTQIYIRGLLEQYVDIVEDEDFAPIVSFTPGLWKASSVENRAKAFRPFMEYYGIDEFETMITDLGWKKFMTAYGYTQKDFGEGKRCNQIREDLAEVWDFVQNEPLI